MQVLSSMDALPEGLRFVVVLGMFDGIHRGHQRILATTVAAARELSAEPVLLTFDPHPETVLRGVRPMLLCDPEERLARFAAAGIGTTVVQHFDRQFAAQSAEEFLHRLARGRTLAGLVVTPETAFGHDRTGTVTVIEQLAPTIGYRVIHMPQEKSRGAPISSSRLRQLLAAGQLDDVRRMLGRPYAVIGEIDVDAPGQQSLSVAVADDLALPPPGRYSVRCWPATDGLLDPAHRFRATAEVVDGAVSLVLSARAGRSTSSQGSRWRIEFVRQVGMQPHG